MAFFSASEPAFYDVSWLVSGMVVREWDSFCPNAPPTCNPANSVLSSSSGGASHTADAPLISLQTDSTLCSRAPTVEISYVGSPIHSMPPDLSLAHDSDISFPDASKSYALRSSHFHVRSQFNPSTWRTLWLELPLTEDAVPKALADIGQWLGSSECSIFRLILACACSPTVHDHRSPAVERAISSILSKLAESQPQSPIRHLVFYNCSLSIQVHWPLLVQLLTSPNCPLRSLAFAHLYSGVDVKSLVEILQHPSCQLSELLIHNSPNLSERRCIKHLLQPLYSPDSCLRRLSLSSCHLKDTDMEDICLLLRSPSCKVTALNLSFNFFTIRGLQDLKEALIDSYEESGTLTTPLRMLSFCGNSYHVDDKEVTKAMAEVLETAGCKLTTLDLTGRAADVDWISRLSQILQGDKCQLVSLFLFHYVYNMGGDRLSLNEKLLAGLKMNKRIINFYFPWATETYKQIALDVVQRNMSLQDTHLAEETLVMPKCVKLFICGHEKVGKTTLRKKLIDPSFVHLVGSLILRTFKNQPRTQGMHLCTLSLQDRKTVVVCDLAGQREYHALHHFFMTSSNEDLFAVVCKCEARGVAGPQSVNFQKKLNYWLSFVVSLRARPYPKPRVILVVNFFGSHMSVEEMATNARIATSSAVEKFGDLLDFGIDSSNVLGVDLLSTMPSTCIDPIMHKIEALATELMNARMPIFKISEDIQSAIVDPSRRWNMMESLSCLVPYKKLPIVVTVGRLLEEFESSSRRSAAHNRCTFPVFDEALEAALLQLHNLGQVVFFRLKVGTRDRARDEQIVILDPAWFYEKLIGAIFEPFRRNQGYGKALEHAVWNKAILKEHILKNAKQSLDSKSAEYILDYMAKLELYFVLSSEGGSNMLLFPSMLSDEGNPEISLFLEGASCGTSSHGHFSFYGRRLVCENSETSLLPWAVFTRLQVQLHAKYGKDPEHNFNVGYSWIQFTQNKVQAVIKFVGTTGDWEDHYCIDVLLRLPEKASGRDLLVAQDIICKVRNSVLQICQACDRGCLKLSLQEKILAHPQDMKPVLLSELKKKIHMEGIVGDNAEMALSKLLLPGELQELLNENAEAVRMLRNELELQEDEEMRRSGNEINRPCSFDMASIGGGNVGLEEVLRKVVEELKSTVTGLYSELSKQLLMEKGSSTSGSAGSDEELPCFPLLIRDEGMGSLGKLKLGMENKEARLHLMCESVQGCHRVENQKGLNVNVSGAKSKVVVVASVLIPGLKLVYGAAKIMASIFLPGSGNVIEGMGGLFEALGLAEKLFEALSLPEKLSMQSHKKVCTFPQLLTSLARVEGLPEDLVQQNLVRLGRPPGPLLKEFYCYILEGQKQYVHMQRDFSLTLVRFPDTQRTSWLCNKHIDDRRFVVNKLNPFQFLQLDQRH